MQNLFFYTSFTAEELSKYTEQSKVILEYMKQYLNYFYLIQVNRESFMTDFK
jgi:hypothetical protein